MIACGFGEPDADARAADILGRRLPAATSSTIDARPIFERGGGIHCITQQQPKSVGHESIDPRRRGLDRRLRAALESRPTTARRAGRTAYLARIDAYDGAETAYRAQRAWSSLNPDALAEAAASDARRAARADARAARRHPVHRQGQLHGARG